MKDIYLISSLGMSPGVVTGVIDALQYEGLKETYNPNYIAVITTDHELTRLSLDVIERDMKKYNPHIKILPYIMKGVADIITEEDNRVIMRTFVNAVKEGNRLRSEGKVDELHVNIAGGRKTMSGIFTSFSNIFPVDRVYHLLTTPEMEQKGYIKNFLNSDGVLDEKKIDSEGLKENLHPKVANAPSSLVEIPILHSFDFKNLLDLTKRIKNQQEITQHDLTETMVEGNMLIREGKNSFKITEKGQLLFDLFQYYISK
jgi:CRISPR-associated Csx14 family protein